MTTLLYTHPVCLEHDTGYGHPESPTRLTAILNALRTAQFAALKWRDAPPATVEQLIRIHTPAYIDRVFARVPKQGHHALDGDTILSPQSGEAALRAAGAVCAAVDAVLGQEASNAFCAIRPPGHHAEPNQAMGFCLFSNAALAARHLQARGLQRILIVDFDVHHGNGTQAAFYADPSVLFISTHQQGIYPLSGAEDETGAADGQGATINVPVPAGAGDRAFARILETLIAPAAARFQPDFLLVSAGYDAHWRDPLAALQLSTTGYFQLVRGLRALAQAQCAGRLALILEGGYDPHALADSVAASLHALLGEDSAPDPLGGAPYPEPLARVEAALYRLRARHAL